MKAFRATEVVSTPDGDFTLAIDMGVVDALEDEFDMGFDEITLGFQKKVRFGKLARLLRGLLASHHPELSLDDVGGFLVQYGDEFGTGLGRLFEKAQPEPETATANPPKPRRGAQKNSSGHGALAA